MSLSKSDKVKAFGGSNPPLSAKMIIKKVVVMNNKEVKLVDFKEEHKKELNTWQEIEKENGDNGLNRFVVASGTKLGDYIEFFTKQIELFSKIALDNGEIVGHKMRCSNSKYSTVKALQSVGFETICAGDSYNDLGMIRASKAGFLFKSPEKIKLDNPDLLAFETYDELLNAIEKVL